MVVVIAVLTKKIEEAVRKRKSGVAVEVEQEMESEVVVGTGEVAVETGVVEVGTGEEAAVVVKEAEVEIDVAEVIVGVVGIEDAPEVEVETEEFIAVITDQDQEHHAEIEEGTGHDQEVPGGIHHLEVH